MQTSAPSWTIGWPWKEVVTVCVCGTLQRSVWVMVAQLSRVQGLDESLHKKYLGEGIPSCLPIHLGESSAWAWNCCDERGAWCSMIEWLHHLHWDYISRLRKAGISKGDLVFFVATIDRWVWHGLYVSPMALKPIGVCLRLSVLESEGCQMTIMITKNTVYTS